MNEEIEKCMNNILASIEDWEEEKSLHNAKKLNLQLTLLMLLVRPSEFNQLNAFARYLRDTSRAIDEAEKKGDA